MTKARAYPIESFGPELLQALLAGAKARLEVELPTYRAAVRMQLRLHQLRKQLQLANHPLYPLVARARTTVRWGERANYAPVEERFSSRGVPRPRNTSVPCKIVIEPSDSEFAYALQKAGVQVHDLVEDPLATTPLAESSGGDYLDQVTKIGHPTASTSKKEP